MQGQMIDLKIRGPITVPHQTLPYVRVHVTN
jgi:hypothetical protein